MCAVIDTSALQVNARWHRALLEVIWMGVLLRDWVPQKLTTIQGHIQRILC